MTYKSSLPPSAVSNVHVPASWSSLFGQLRSLLTRSPYIVGGAVVATVAVAAMSYQQSQIKRRELSKRKQALRYVRTNFSHRRLDVLKFIFESKWNRFDLATLESIWAKFSSLIKDPRRGLLPIGDIVELYRQVGIKDEKVAMACARFWDVDGNCRVDFIELVERLNLAHFGSKRDLLRAYFGVFDLDGSHAICKDEMEEVLTALSAASHQHASKQDVHHIVQNIFSKADKNLAGKITLNEFLALAEVETLTFGFNKDFIKAFGI